MSIPGPITPAIRARVPFNVDNILYPQVVPFTIRDNANYLTELEMIKGWILKIEPSLNDTIKDLVDAWISNAEEIVRVVNETLDEYDSDIKAQLEAQNAKIAASLASQNESIANAISQFETDVEKQLSDNLTAVNSAIAEVINNTIAVTDPVISGVFGEPLNNSARVLAAMGNTPYNIRNYGAKGDIAGDDTDAIMRAIVAANGAEVYVPAGVYPANLVITSPTLPVIIRGPGILVRTAKGSALTIRRDLGVAASVTELALMTLAAVSGNPSGAQKVQIVRASTIAGIGAGDVLLINADGFYPWSVSGNSGVYKAGIIEVNGIGLVSTVSGGNIVARQTVVGATSGASAIVAAVTVNDASQTLVFDTVNGEFVAGETITVTGSTAVRGTVTGAPFIVSNQPLDDTYTTNPKIRKIPSAPLDIDVTVTGDLANPWTNTVSSTVRQDPAVQISGQAGGRVRVHAFRTYGRGVQLRGATYGIEYDVYARDLPNIGESIEGAYGYGIEFTGASERHVGSVHAWHVRHAATTNSSSNNAGNLNYDIYKVGTPKRNVVMNSTGIDCMSSAFDTHPGAYFTIFDDCIGIMSNGAGRVLTANGAVFNDRGLGTITRNCLSIGGYIAFYTSSHVLESPFPNRPVYEYCTGLDWSHSGFTASTSASSSTTTRYKIRGMVLRGNGSAANDPSYQYAFSLTGIRAHVIGCEASRFSGAPILAQSIGGIGEILVIDFLADYRESDGATALRVNPPTAVNGVTDQLNLKLVDYKVLATATTPNGYVRNSSGQELRVYSNGILALENAKPFVSSSGNAAIVHSNIDRVFPV